MNPLGVALRPQEIAQYYLFLLSGEGRAMTGQVRTIENLGDMVKTLQEGTAERKSDVYRSIGLRAEFDPRTRKCGPR
ncbi:hypothetical protein [Streptosporangium sp. NPDC049046]|uniref:hypothetical protein n=1 Tax=Streptosporangium sp. NPDC049046 TaxID=3155031 RepID=UPI003444DD9B